MIFPEGTLYYKPMINKSNKICVTNNIVKYKNVLFPKRNGFNTLKEILKPKYITDITFKYHVKNNEIYILLSNERKYKKYIK